MRASAMSVGGAGEDVSEVCEASSYGDDSRADEHIGTEDAGEWIDELLPSAAVHSTAYGPPHGTSSTNSAGAISPELLRRDAFASAGAAPAGAASCASSSA
eukprot:5514024-Prymnesium_polylepis.1